MTLTSSRLPVTKTLRQHHLALLLLLVKLWAPAKLTRYHFTRYTLSASTPLQGGSETKRTVCFVKMQCIYENFLYKAISTPVMERLLQKHWFKTEMPVVVAAPCTRYCAACVHASMWYRCCITMKSHTLWYVKTSQVTFDNNAVAKS